MRHAVQNVQSAGIRGSDVHVAVPGYRTGTVAAAAIPFRDFELIGRREWADCVPRPGIGCTSQRKQADHSV